MSIRRSQARFYIIVGLVALLAVLNATSGPGDRLADQREALLQLCAGLGAIACGLVGARQTNGIPRWWRLLYSVALALWLLGQTVWWTGDAGTGSANIPGVVAYLLLPVVALPAVFLLVRSSGKVFGPDGLLGHPPVTSLIDGVVAGLAFLILVVMGGFGASSSASLPRSGIPAVEVAFAVAELVIVAVMVLVATVYEPDRPCRKNYLLLATGLIAMAASDRVIAYFRAVGVEGGEHWSGIGLILGPVLIAFAMLHYPPGSPDTEPGGGINWAQLILPYVGFMGIAVLFAFHVLIGRELNPFAVCATVLMVMLVTVRQMIAMGAQWLLTQRLYGAQSRLAHQVHHDALTGLPNRLLFAVRLDEAMRTGDFVLIFVDLDDFKEINDRFGHGAGDELLRAVGERLKRCVTERDTLARVGGDEFAILIHNDAAEELETVSDRVRVALRDPFPVHGSSVRVRASMGLVRQRASDETQSSDDLMRQADISMYAGKQLGKNTAVIYQPLAGVRADFPPALRAAKGGVPAGFGLVYQPVVRLPDETVLAVEALARWTAPNGMHISPETFVGATEAAGLGGALDAMVLELAIREIAAAGWDVDIHVNVGAARLGNPGFEDQVLQTLSRHKVAANRLVVEITETVPIVDLEHAAAQIARLSATGIRVALDDFGAGYNSLTYLHALPVHIVKLDRGLAAGTDPVRNVALYRSVIGLSTDLGLDVIAEGIESTAQLDTIRAAGCRFAQGHLFGRPLPVGDVAHKQLVKG